MRVVPLQNFCFENRIFHGDVIKFNKVAKVALVILGAVALESAYLFSATPLSLAIGGILFLAALVATQTLVFHNRKLSEQMKKALEQAIQNNDQRSSAYLALAELIGNPNVSPENSHKQRIVQQWEYLGLAAEDNKDPVQLGKIRLACGRLYECHGDLIRPEATRNQNLRDAEAQYQLATLISVGQETRKAAYHALISLYETKGLEFLNQAERQRKIDDFEGQLRLLISTTK